MDPQHLFARGMRCLLQSRLQRPCSATAELLLQQRHARRGLCELFHERRDGVALALDGAAQPLDHAPEPPHFLGALLRGKHVRGQRAAVDPVPPLLAEEALAVTRRLPHVPEPPGQMVVLGRRRNAAQEVPVRHHIAAGVHEGLLRGERDTLEYVQLGGPPPHLVDADEASRDEPRCPQQLLRGWLGLVAINPSQTVRQSPQQTAQQSCTGKLHGQVAHQSCTASLHGKVARQSCTGKLHGQVAHQSCTAKLHGTVARQSCTGKLHGRVAHQSCTARLHTKAARQGCTGKLRRGSCTGKLHVKLHGKPAQESCTGKLHGKAARLIATSLGSSTASWRPVFSIWKYSCGAMPLDVRSVPTYHTSS
jgi:hypothetical protein